MRVWDWYFQGWERRADENGKTVFVYTGEYYLLPTGRPKLVTGALTAALLAAYLTTALLPSAGGMWRLAAVPQLLELIPLVYLVMGLVCLLRVQDPMTYRDYHASWRRSSRASLVSAVFTAGMAVVEIVYIILYTGGGIASEIPYLLMELGCFVISLLLWLYIKRHPCVSSRE